MLEKNLFSVFYKNYKKKYSNIVLRINKILKIKEIARLKSFFFGPKMPKIRDKKKYSKRFNIYFNLKYDIINGR